MTTFRRDRTWPWGDLDHSSAATLLANHLPAVDRAGLEPFGEGDFNLAFRLGNQVVRVARHLEAAAALRREVCVLTQIAAMLPLPIPRPAYHSPRACPPFAVHDEVVGEVLTREVWVNMPIVARKKAAADLATFLRELHALPAEIGLECGLEQLDGVEFARRLREATTDTIHGLLDLETRKRLDASLRRWSLPSSQEERRLVLLHCDIAPGHLLCDPLTGSLTGVIDFGDMAIGDPARDFIYIYEDYGTAILMEVLSVYEGKHAPSMLSEIRKWYLLEAIAWTVEMWAVQRASEMEHGLAEITGELAAQAAP